MKKDVNPRLKLSPETVLEDLINLKVFNSNEKIAVAKIAAKYKAAQEKITKHLEILKERKTIKTDENGNIVCLLKSESGKVVSKTQNQSIFVKLNDGKEIYVYNPKGAQIGSNVNIYITQRFGKTEGIIDSIESGDILYGAISKNPNGAGYIFKSDDYRIKDEIIVAHAEKYADKKVKIKIDHSCDGVYFDEKSGENVLFADVLEDFGLARSENAEIYSIIDKHDFTPPKYTEEELAQLNNIPEELTEEDKEDCFDRTDIPFITIDPEGCGDMDDAIHVEKTENGYRAYIALADVEHYVPVGSPLFLRALELAMSLYPGNLVLPMLHEKISKGICSLSKDKDRRVILGVYDLDNDGSIKSYSFENSIINVRENLSYETADEIHNGTTDANSIIKNSIDNSYLLSNVLTKIRNDRGALSFKSEENTHIFNEEGQKVIDAVDKTTIPSTKVIESLMILYDEYIAAFKQENNIISLFRIHEAPDKKDIETLVEFAAKKLGISIDNDTQDDQFIDKLHEILDKAKGTKFFDVISSYALSKQKKAKYSTNNIGHYGLGISAEKAYEHATAAIRRFADLIGQAVTKHCIKLLNYCEYLKMNNIAITKTELENTMDRIPYKEVIAKIKNNKHDFKNFKNLSKEEKQILADCKYSKNNVDMDKYIEIANHITYKDIMSEKCEREVKRYYDALWAENKIGEIFKGEIYGINNIDTTVRLTRENIPVTVPTLSLLKSDKIKFEKDYKISAVLKSGKVENLSLGDTIYVKIDNVDINTRRINTLRDFEAEKDIKKGKASSGYTSCGLSDLQEILNRKESILKCIEDYKSNPDEDYEKQ